MKLSKDKVTEFTVETFENVTKKVAIGFVRANAKEEAQEVAFKYIQQNVKTLMTFSGLEDNVLDQLKAHKISYEDRRPPQLAAFLLCLFLSASDRDNMLGDLTEKFEEWVELHGVRMARFFYLKDACTTIYPAAQKLWWRIFKLLAKVGGIAGILEIIRQIRFW